MSFKADGAMSKYNEKQIKLPKAGSGTPLVKGGGGNGTYESIFIKIYRILKRARKNK